MYDVKDVIDENQASSQLSKLGKILDGAMIGESHTNVIDGKVIVKGDILLTPEVAEELIEFNLNNRPETKLHVTKLVKQLVGGHWSYNAQPIIFDESGTLSDGQHRLRGCILSGVSFIVAVSVGVEEGSFSKMDNNKSRSTSDVMAIGGVSNSKIANAVTQHIYSFRNGRFSANKTALRNLSNTEILDYYHQLPNIEESIKLAMRLSKRSQKFVTPKMLATFHYLFSEKDPELATEFITDLALGENFTNGRPVKALFNKFMKAKMDKTYKFTGMEMDKHMVYAWNKTRNGEKVKRFNIDDDFEIVIL